MDVVVVNPICLVGAATVVMKGFRQESVVTHRDILDAGAGAAETALYSCRCCRWSRWLRDWCRQYKCPRNVGADHILAPKRQALGGNFNRTNDGSHRTLEIIHAQTQAESGDRRSCVRRGGNTERRIIVGEGRV